MPTQPLPSIDRRAFLRGSTVVAAAAGIAAPFQALSASAQDKRHDDRGRGRSCSPDYGPLSAVKDGAIRPIDDVVVTRPGPRLADGIRALALAIHPDLVLPSAAP